MGGGLEKRGRKRVDREIDLAPRAVKVLRVQRFSRDRLDVRVDKRLCLGRMRRDERGCVELGVDDGRNCVRVLLEECGGGDGVRDDELAGFPQALLVHQLFAPALGDHSAHPGLRNPGPVELACNEPGERHGIVLRSDVHVSAALGGRGETLRLQEVAECDILGVAKLR